MAKKRSARQAARTTADKWQEKQWYTIRAPSIFNDADIGETLADEEEKLEDRVAEATLQDVTGDFSKQHVKCYFRIRGTRGTDAVTTFDGHDLTSDYVRRLVRRSHSKIDVVADVTTADGFTVRLKPMIVSERRTQKAQRKEIRTRARDVLEEAADTDFNDLVLKVLEGDVAKEIYDRARLILPLKRVEVRKSEVISEPEDATETLDVFAPPEDEEEEEEAEDEEEAEGDEEPEEPDEAEDDEGEGEDAEEAEEPEPEEEPEEAEDEPEEEAEASEDADEAEETEAAEEEAEADTEEQAAEDEPEAEIDEEIVDDVSEELEG